MAKSRFISSMRDLGHLITYTRTYQICIRKAENVVLSGVGVGLKLLYIYDDRRGDYEGWRSSDRY
jgi:hypothetical protein